MHNALAHVKTDSQPDIRIHVIFPMKPTEVGYNIYNVYIVCIVCIHVYVSCEMYATSVDLQLQYKTRDTYNTCSNKQVFTRAKVSFTGTVRSQHAG